MIKSKNYNAFHNNIKELNTILVVKETVGR